MASTSTARSQPESPITTVSFNFDEDIDIDTGDVPEEAEMETDFRNEPAEVAMETDPTFNAWSEGASDSRRRPNEGAIVPRSGKLRVVEADQSINLREKLRYEKDISHARMRRMSEQYKNEAKAFEYKYHHQAALLEAQVRNQTAMQVEFWAQIRKRDEDHKAEMVRREENILKEARRQQAELVAQQTKESAAVEKLQTELESVQAKAEALRIEHEKLQKTLKAQKDDEFSAMQKQFKSLSQKGARTTPATQPIQGSISGRRGTRESTPVKTKSWRNRQRHFSKRIVLTAFDDDVSASGQMSDGSVELQEIDEKPAGVTKPVGVALAPADERVITIVEEAIRRGASLTNKDTIAQGKTPKRRRKKYSRKSNVQLEVERQKEDETEDEHLEILALVRKLYSTIFGFETDDDVMDHEPAPAEEVKTYSQGIGPGPNVDDLHWDMHGLVNSAWNNAVCQILVGELHVLLGEMAWGYPERSDDYYQDYIKEKFKRLRTKWRTAQPQYSADGFVETERQTEERINDREERRHKAARQRQRRQNKYERRIATVEYMIKLRTSERGGDLPIWKWFGEVLSHLGTDGMSSEESSIEDDIESIYRVKTMVWRRNLERELDIIDRQRLLDTDIFAPQGSKPVKRHRGDRNLVSARKPMCGLPRAFYNDEWYNEVDNDIREVEFGVSMKPFRWLKNIVAASL